MSVSPVRPVVTPAPRRVVDAPSNGAAVPPAAAPPLAAPLPALNCQISGTNPDGSIHATIHIDAMITRRLKTRAGNVPLNDYLWINVIRPALESHVF